MALKMVFNIEAELINSRGVTNKINKLETDDSLNTKEAEKLDELPTLVPLVNDSPDLE